MPKKNADAFVMSESMWGKPLASSVRKSDDEKKKVTRMQAEEQDDDIDSDVDAELEEGEDTEVGLADENDDELVEDEATASADEPAGEDDEEEVAAAVADDEEDVPGTKGANNRNAAMSEKKSGADHIRDEIAKRKDAGDSMRGVDIVAALAKRKIEVSPAQVSQLLKKAGMGGAPRAKKTDADAKSRVAAKGKKQLAPAETARVLPKRPAVTTGKSTMLPMTQLKAAAAFLAACDNCYATAEEILSTHKQLGSVYDVSR